MNGPSWREQFSRTAGNQPATLIAICDAFLQEVPMLVGQIKQAVKSNDANSLRIAAHTLKSCLRYVAPADDVNVAWEIEKNANSPDAITEAQVDDIERIATHWCQCVKTLQQETEQL
ncbi:Hpt domain protein [Planctomycetes bacterium CA13]|uniref:Hpt domain protein n=1 Tax=Novipirellula herctigrandis TaxID=2527986 RepID=A0A5C5Z379_9BACT|nr:Hpt domain protein [Planctomycetes bacterium CA13]